jgi:hypothetical protein
MPRRRASSVLCDVVSALEWPPAASQTRTEINFYRCSVPPEFAEAANSIAYWLF